MSIYSGFATRHQEETYDSLTQDLIYVLQRRILKFYTKQQADEQKFLSILSHIYHSLSKMEESKYLQPKLSKSMEELLKHLQHNESHSLKNIDNVFMTPGGKLDRQKLPMPRKFSAHLKAVGKHDASSVGKIMKQLNSRIESSVSAVESPHTTNPHKITEQNPETQPPSNKTNIQHQLHNYLQQGTKASVRGYRRRQVKSKSSRQG